MSLNKLLTGALVVQLVILGTLIVAPAETRPQPANAQQVSDKYDGDCTGTETAGRCQDKCPPGSYAIGYEDNGAAICKAEPTGCPYGDSIPLGPECDKHAPQQTNQPAQPQAAQCGGK